MDIVKIESIYVIIDWQQHKDSYWWNARRMSLSRFELRHSLVFDETVSKASQAQRKAFSRSDHTAATVVPFFCKLWLKMTQTGAFQDPFQDLQEFRLADPAASRGSGSKPCWRI